VETPIRQSRPGLLLYGKLGKTSGRLCKSFPRVKDVSISASGGIDGGFVEARGAMVRFRLKEVSMVKTGFVGFFDILGYKSFMKNNDLPTVATLIHETLLTLPQKTKEKIKARDWRFRELEEENLNPIETLVISDSFVFLLPVSDLTPNVKLTRTLTFVHYAETFVREMFHSGLPVRGAIDYGEFFAEDHCFAGKPIMHCHQLAEELELSGGVVSSAATCKITELLGLLDTRVPRDDLGLMYLVPKKGECSERLFLLDWWDHEKNHSDIRQAVFEAFQGHRKDIRENVYPKLENTELSIRALVKYHRDRNKK